MYFVSDKGCTKSSQELNSQCLFKLVSREYDYRLNYRRDHRITRNLILSNSYKLERCWSMKSPQRITCDGRFAFFSNYQTCIDCSSNRRDPHIKYNLPAKGRHEKIEDAIIVDGTPESLSLPFQGHKAVLLAVSKDNWLFRISLDSGQVLERVKLAKPQIKFKKINWNAVDETFVVTSKHYLSHSRTSPRRDTFEGIQFIVMGCMPIKYVAKFSVTKEIFGKTMLEACVSLDILMVMYSTSHVRMYSMPLLIEQYRTHHHSLYDKLPDGCVFGSDQYPLTHNVDITDCPPCILEVRCRERDVMVTMPPCHYVMWPWKQTRGYCCYSVQTGKMVDNGCLQAEDDSLEEKVALHADDSCRIIHMKNAELRVFKLVAQAGTDNRKMVEDFTIDLSVPKESQPDPGLSVSLSGRILKKRVLPDCQEIADRTVLSMTYSEDLDMIVLLSCFGDSSSDGFGDRQVTVVGFYDNWNGKLHRQFELPDAPTEEVSERFFTYEEDTVTHVFRTLQGKMECHVYKLECDVIDTTSSSSSRCRGRQEVTDTNTSSSRCRGGWNRR